LTVTPTFEERVLGGVLGIVAVAQEEHQGADQFVTQLVERAHQRIFGGRESVPLGDRPDGRARAESLHGYYPYDERAPPTDCRLRKNSRTEWRHVKEMLTATRNGSNQLVTQ